jgi:hypothetical protein
MRILTLSARATAPNQPGNPRHVWSCAVPKKSPVKTKAIAPAIKPLTASRAEAAAMLGFDVQTIDVLISAGKLRASKPVRRVVIRLADIERMLDASAVQS